MKLGLKAVVAIVLAVVGLEILAEKLDVSTAMAEPMQRAEKPGANGVGR